MLKTKTPKNTISLWGPCVQERTKRNKRSTAYDRDSSIIYKINWSTISARRKRDGREVSRDSSHFKLAMVSEQQNVTENESNKRQYDLRETILRKSKRRKQLAPLLQDADNRTGTYEETINEERQVAEDETGNREEQQPRRSEWQNGDQYI